MDLTWLNITQKITKKSQQRLYFLRLRKCSMSTKILSSFYRSTVQCHYLLCHGLVRKLQSTRQESTFAVHMSKLVNKTILNLKCYFSVGVNHWMGWLWLKKHCPTEYWLNLPNLFVFITDGTTDAGELDLSGIDDDEINLVCTSCIKGHLLPNPVFCW